MIYITIYRFLFCVYIYPEPIGIKYKKYFSCFLFYFTQLNHWPSFLESENPALQGDISVDPIASMSVEAAYPLALYPARCCLPPPTRRGVYNSVQVRIFVRVKTDLEPDCNQTLPLATILLEGFMADNCRKSLELLAGSGTSWMEEASAVTWCKADTFQGAPSVLDSYQWAGLMAVIRSVGLSSSTYRALWSFNPLQKFWSLAPDSMNWPAQIICHYTGLLKLTQLSQLIAFHRRTETKGEVSHLPIHGTRVASSASRWKDASETFSLLRVCWCRKKWSPT